jgi:hypothetical protein
MKSDVGSRIVTGNNAIGSLTNRTNNKAKAQKKL